MWQVTKMLIQKMSVKHTLTTYLICFREPLTDKQCFPNLKQNNNKKHACLVKKVKK